MIWSLFIYNDWNILVQFICSCVSASLSFVGPYFLREILSFVEDPKSVSSIYVPLGYAGCIFAVATIRAFTDGQTYFIGRRIGLRVRAIVIDLVYEKSLTRISKSADLAADLDPDSQADAGRVMNLMSVGADQLI